MPENNPLFHVEHNQTPSVPRGTTVSVDSCPICHREEFKTRHISTDHTVSHERFSLQECSECGFLMTSPRPTDGILPSYYASEAYVSHSESKKGIINRLYYFVQQINLRSKFKLAKKHAPEGNWLDYGSGSGAFLQYADQKGINIVGIEPDETARNNATQKGQTSHNVDHYNNHLQKFACITMWHVLEHIPNFKEVLLQHAHRLLPFGTLIIAVPNWKSFDANYYGAEWAALDVPRHLWHFTEKDIQSLAMDIGLNYKSCHPMLFDSFYVSMLSAKYNNSSMLHAMRIGLQSNIKGLRSEAPYSSQIYILRKPAI